MERTAQKREHFPFGEEALPFSQEEKDLVTFFAYELPAVISPVRDEKGRYGPELAGASTRSCKTKKGTKNLLSWAPLELKTGAGARPAGSRPLTLEPGLRPVQGFTERQLSFGSHRCCLRAGLNHHCV